MDYRWYGTIVVSGLVLPIATVFGALSVAIDVEIPPQLTFVVLLVLPLVAIVLTYAMALYSDLSVPFEDRLPYGGQAQFRDEIPEHYQDAFATETLDAPPESTADGSNTIVTAYLVYLVSIPVYTLVVWLFLSA
jgi:hypothetical protein